MHRDRPSKTAANIAAARAREAARPQGERICDDPLAVHFLSPAFRLMRRIAPVHAYLQRRNNRLLPGMLGALVARTRFIDDCLRSALDNGLQQLVILGAGYDSRAYRFDGLEEQRIRVFEVDHPATQAVKIRRLTALYGRRPAHVAFVPVRFHREALACGLLNAGYDGSLKTFFVWEGVTMYLSAASVDRTLRFMADNSRQGSETVFDCFPPEVVDGRSPLREARTLRRYVARIGEPLRFGLDAEAIEGFLAARGFTAVRVVNSAACKPLYFKGADARRKVSAILSFVHAAVAGRP